MIVGLGNDICHIKRIENTLVRFGDRFKHRLFTNSECHYADAKPHHSATRYAQFFAAKEACAKALGSGIAEGVFFRDIEILHNDKGAPYLQLHNHAGEVLNSKNAACHLTLSADAGIANAVVLLESTT